MKSGFFAQFPASLAEAFDGSMALSAAACYGLKSKSSDPWTLGPLDPCTVGPLAAAACRIARIVSNTFRWSPSTCIVAMTQTSSAICKAGIEIKKGKVNPRGKSCKSHTVFDCSLDGLASLLLSALTSIAAMRSCRVVRCSTHNAADFSVLQLRFIYVQDLPCACYGFGQRSAKLNLRNFDLGSLDSAFTVLCQSP